MLSRFDTPFSDISQLQRKINSLFNTQFEDYDFPESQMAEREKGWFLPHIDVKERDDDILIHAELPGVDKENVKIQLNEDGNLEISGEKKELVQEDLEGYHKKERKYGFFKRVLPMPKGLEHEKIHAKMNAGVLEVVIEKPAGLGEEKEKKKIEIK